MPAMMHILLLQSSVERITIMIVIAVVTIMIIRTNYPCLIPTSSILLVICNIVVVVVVDAIH
jgi:hypothetical protein